MPDSVIMTLTLYVLNFWRGQNMYSHFMTQAIEILPQGRQGPYIDNIMAADVLSTQGARAPATMILTYFNRDNPQSHTHPPTLRVNPYCRSTIHSFLHNNWCNAFFYLIMMLCDSVCIIS